MQEALNTCVLDGDAPKDTAYLSLSRPTVCLAQVSELHGERCPDSTSHSPVWGQGELCAALGAGGKKLTPSAAPQSSVKPIPTMVSIKHMMEALLLEGLTWSPLGLHGNHPYPEFSWAPQI